MDYPKESMTLPTELLKKYLNPTFVETGSYDGRTIQQALDAGFERVISVEVDPGYAQICRMRFTGNNKVEIWEGDSLDHLWDMIESVDTPITYWLDAHFQDAPVTGKLKVPILEELKIIGKHSHIKDSIVMVDDLRLFGSHSHWKPVTSLALVDTIQDIFPGSFIEFEDSKAAPKDIVVIKSCYDNH